MKIQAHTFCEAFWRGKTRRFALALHNESLHFWETDSPSGEQLFVLVEPFKVSHTAKINPDFVRHNFEVEWERLRLNRVKVARVITLDADTIYLQPDGAGRANVMVSTREKSVYPQEQDAWFHFDGGEDVFSLSDGEWQARLQLWTNEENNDFAFALRFPCLSPREQRDVLMRPTRGDWNEVEGIARQILDLEGDRIAAQSQEEEEGLLFAQLILQEEDGEWAVELDLLSLDPNSPFGPLWRACFDFFALAPNREMLVRHITARESAKHRSENFSRPFGERTAHEQLETRLQLRDWLRERVELSDERIAQLLN